MLIAEIIAQLSEAQVVALTLFGEARGEPIEGRIAIASIIRNRVTLKRHAFGLTPREACLKRWQFSCWIPEGGAVNYGVLMDAVHLVSSNALSPMLRECLWVADGALGGLFLESVKGSTHYYNPAAMKPAGTMPDWAVGKTPACTINAHLFFKDIK